MISSSWSLKCEQCDYISAPQKMYDEKELVPGKTGPKPSTLNDALGFALLKSSVGASQFREIFLNLGMNPGSLSSIQDPMTKCGQTLCEIAGANMAEERKNVKLTLISVYAWMDGTPQGTRTVRGRRRPKRHSPP